ncbi:MAG: cytochrome c biogenesis protein CcdA [Rhodobacter sp.]|nr:cytochrome c biogenesis protein CcdA [Rhodobacter sp.]MCA3519665.1 cytochrome c biogenesis protein CcdA [Rhodobacter sp.]MCA3529031.1 cytochrome c biogenesis protein CcdA [Rhodobacter sp.]MCA3531018.1 cytochrome c biogenesis protein CcdA [Rhodobacter sp.]MCA3535948.1 cytochrome c biogenesis protein CcdA [Rhodobacter sp.]
MDLIFAYLAGLLTLINPCVLPVLPIVVASSLQTDPRAPLALAAGMGLSFVAVGTGVAAIGPAVGIYPDDVTRIAALVMVGFGLVMVLPALGRRFSMASAGIAAAADARIAATPRGIGAEFAGGALLGAVWSPCIGPTLGAAIALASTGESLGNAAAVMAAFAGGVATLILAAAYGLRGWLRRNVARAVALSARARPVMGWVFIAVGGALFLGLNHILDEAALRLLPAWLVDLSVSI